jgi:hypothetical protein
MIFYNCSAELKCQKLDSNLRYVTISQKGLQFINIYLNLLWYKIFSTLDIFENRTMEIKLVSPMRYSCLPPTTQLTKGFTKIWLQQIDWLYNWLICSCFYAWCLVYNHGLRNLAESYVEAATTSRLTLQLLGRRKRWTVSLNIITWQDNTIAAFTSVLNIRV